jgi:uncharacterized protein (DUF2062 family)
MFTTSTPDPGGRGWRQRFAAPLLSLLLGGASPHHLAVALALGAMIGLMPLAWGTSLLCLAVALLLRLNPAAVQLANFAVYPVQIALFLPFFRLGECWFGPSTVSRAAPAPWRLLAADPLGAFCRLVQANGTALLAWGVTTWVLLPLFYLFSRYLLQALVIRSSPEQTFSNCKKSNRIQTNR